jgi:heme/copper-type cytochrome/quinol oxidase subunit 3
MKSRQVREGSHPGRSWAVAAAGVAGGTSILYVWIIATESTRNDPARVAAVIALFLLATVCAIGTAMLAAPEARHVTAAAGTGVLLSLGVLALASVGLLLLVAAGLLIMAIAAGREERRSSSKVRVILAFAIGIALPWALVLIA